ncbi:MAG: substrate-binding periplasmic protein [Oligoflexales bacterium]
MKICRLLLLSIVCLGSSSNLLAQNSPKLSFYTEEFPPYNFKYNSIERDIDGIAVRLLEKIHRQMGKSKKDYRMNLGIWARGYQLAQKKGQQVVLFSTTRTESREKLFKWVGPITKTTISLIKRKDSLATISKGSDFLKFKYCVIKDAIGDILIREKKVPEELINAKTKFEELLTLLLQKDCDFLAYNQKVSEWLMKQHSFNKDDFVVDYELKTSKLYFAFNKSISDKVVNSYQNALDDIIKKNPNYLKEIESLF